MSSAAAIGSQGLTVWFLLLSKAQIMMIYFTCPHCRNSSDISAKYAGQTGACRFCGETITIPGATSGDVGPLESAPRSGSSGLGLGLIIVSVVGVVGLAVVGILVALLLPAVSTARSTARRVQCSNHLKQIALAFHNYHDVYGTLPPAYIEDQDGRPQHSWRVLILPFLEQQDLYDRYRFDEPWDSPHNRQVTAESVPVYSCPSGGEPTTDTNYMLITGNSTLFEGQQAVKFSEITDGTSNTIMVVEVQDAKVHWARPVDLEAARVPPLLGSGGGGIDSLHRGGANVAFADGSVRFLPFDSDSESKLPALITPRGGEDVSLTNR